MQARPIFLLLLLTALPPTAASAAPAFHEDCSQEFGDDWEWFDATGKDYYSSWEDLLLLGTDSPPSDVDAVVTLQCKIAGFSIPFGELCESVSGCVKFWAQLDPKEQPGWGTVGTPSVPDCVGLIHVSAPGEVGVTLIPRETPKQNNNGILCEGYCPKDVGACKLGTTVEVEIQLRLTYDWEAPDVAAPGSLWDSTFVALNRAGRGEEHTHRTCQQGTPLNLLSC